MADFARMETRLEYDNKKRSLELHATEHFVSDDSVVLTVQGNLNTKTGACQGGLSLRKRFFPEATNRWYTRADLGASYETATDEIRYGAEAKKSFELTADGLLTFDVEGGVQISAARRRTWNGRVEVSQKIFNFTEDQDLKLKVGYDAAKRRPYGQIRENNWTLDTDFRKNWSLKYDL